MIFEYLPMIVDVLKETNFYYYGDIRTQLRYSLLDYLNYSFISKKEYIEKIINQICSINCNKDFYPPRKYNKNLKKKIQKIII